ncbi:MAG: acetyl-CoA carboxylase biotin carboxyl carrier protein subunit [Oscillospiraceae bacterium]
MEESKIRMYAKLLHELELSALEISENGSVLRLEKNGAGRAEMPPEVTPSFGISETPAEDLITICSPMVGVFYCAPAEDAVPFVSVGDTVRKGDVLCIIEAMKLMNEITAEQDGVVAEVCVGNNQPVDFGQVLFKLKKD